LHVSLEAYRGGGLAVVLPMLAIVGLIAEPIRQECPEPQDYDTDRREAANADRGRDSLDRGGRLDEIAVIPVLNERFHEYLAGQDKGAGLPRTKRILNCGP
jgi:hypothetical protein